MRYGLLKKRKKKSNIKIHAVPGPLKHTTQIITDVVCAN